MPPPLQVTRLPFGPPCVQLPFVLVIVSCGSAGGLWITPIPFTWSLSTMFFTSAPPVFVTTIV